MASAPYPPRPDVAPRPSRRRSFAGPVVLIVVGVVFLLMNLGKLDHATLFRWYAHYWPVLIIVWGVIKLVEYYAAERQGQRAAGIGFGGGFLIFLVVVTGLAATGASRVNWNAVADQVDIGDNGI